MSQSVRKMGLKARFSARLGKVEDGTWFLSPFVGVPFLGTIGTIVAGLTFFFEADLIVFTISLAFVVAALFIFLVFSLGHDIRILFAIKQGPSAADNIMTGLVFICLVVSVLALAFSPLTRYVLVTPLIWGALLYVTWEVQTKLGSDSGDNPDYYGDGVRWFRVRCVSVITSLVVVLFLLSGQALKPTPGQVLTFADYRNVLIFWGFIWAVATYFGSILVGGVRFSNQSQKQVRG